MDRVLVALGNRGVSVEAAQQYVKDIFRTALPCSGGYHMERGGMSLHVAVGRSYKKYATTENLGACAKYVG